MKIHHGDVELALGPAKMANIVSKLSTGVSKLDIPIHRPKGDHYKQHTTQKEKRVDSEDSVNYKEIKEGRHPLRRKQVFKMQCLNETLFLWHYRKCVHYVHNRRRRKHNIVVAKNHPDERQAPNPVQAVYDIGVRLGLHQPKECPGVSTCRERLNHDIEAF